MDRQLRLADLPEHRYVHYSASSHVCFGGTCRRTRVGTPRPLAYAVQVCTSTFMHVEPENVGRQGH